MRLLHGNEECMEGMNEKERKSLTMSEEEKEGNECEGNLRMRLLSLRMLSEYVCHVLINESAN